MVFFLVISNWVFVTIGCVMWKRYGLRRGCVIFKIVDLVKAVDACVRSAFGNVSFFVSLSSCSICSLPLLCSPNVRLILLVSSCSSSLLRTKYFTLPMLSSAFFSAHLLLSGPNIWSTVRSTSHHIKQPLNQPGQPFNQNLASWSAERA